MDFEDIVDMDWVNSHTIESNPLPSPPLIAIKEEPIDNKEMLVMPTIEQIKQLIELAKKQLELREQLSMVSNTTPEPDDKSEKTINPTTITKRDADIIDHNTISLEEYAKEDGIDIQKLSSKERRQLRNKISARNFRVRRKEYISTLENQINQHKKENEELLEKINLVEHENKQLKFELDSLKCQNIQLNNDVSL